MTDREQIAHLLRRFGLGAGKSEVDEYAPLGVQGTLNKLLDFEQTDQLVTVNPFQMMIDKPGADVNLDTYFVSLWWTLRMLLASRPFEEKLSLFWHSNLATGGDKVEFGPMMLEYLRILREHGPGQFSALLKEVSNCSAMIRYLDKDESIAGRPNENFGREVMELFTIGTGNYSEQDVHESARVFTGYGLRYPVYEGDGKFYQERVTHSIIAGIPMIGGYWCSSLHDRGDKTIFGTTAKYTPDQFLEVLAKKPETAKRIGKKLFENFAYRNAPASVIDKVAQEFTKSGGNTRLVVKKIAEMDEFWSPNCALKQVKSPVDFTVSIVRQLGLTKMLRTLQNSQDPLTPTNPVLKGLSYYVLDKLSKQGQYPLYPPTVKGWDGGNTWASATALTERLHMSQEIFWMGDKGKRVGAMVAKQIVDMKPASDEDAVNGFLQMFDAEHLHSEMPILIQGFKQGGGLTSFKDPEAAPGALSSLARLVFASTDFQFC